MNVREIKFRGKSLMTIEELDQLEIEHKNGYVHGNLILDGRNTFIVGGIADVDQEYIAHEWWVSVEPETVGQYTGLKDKNGREIFGGDVVKFNDGIGSVEYENTLACFYINYKFGLDEWNITIPDLFKDYDAQNLEVIGNVYENSDLLGETS